MKLMLGLIVGFCAPLLFAESSISFKYQKDSYFKKCTYSSSGLMIERGVSGLVTQESRMVSMTPSSQFGFDQMLEDVFISPSSIKPPSPEPVISTIEYLVTNDQSTTLILKKIVNSETVKENGSVYRKDLISFIEAHCN